MILWDCYQVWQQTTERRQSQRLKKLTSCLQTELAPPNQVGQTQLTQERPSQQRRASQAWQARTIQCTHSTPRRWYRADNFLNTSFVFWKKASMTIAPTVLSWPIFGSIAAFIQPAIDIVLQGRPVCHKTFGWGISIYNKPNGGYQHRCSSLYWNPESRPIQRSRHTIPNNKSQMIYSERHYCEGITNSRRQNFASTIN